MAPVFKSKIAKVFVRELKGHTYPMLRVTVPSMIAHKVM